MPLGRSNLSIHITQKSEVDPKPEDYPPVGKAARLGPHTLHTTHYCSFGVFGLGARPHLAKSDRRSEASTLIGDKPRISY